MVQLNMLRLLVGSLVLVHAAAATPSSSSLYLERAKATFSTLNDAYWSDEASWWLSSMWWQSANTVEAMCNLGLLTPDDAALQSDIRARLEATFAATANATVYRADSPGVQFMFSGYFDDEDWWGLAWLKAFELTRDARYLNRSRAIFDDLVARSWR